MKRSTKILGTATVIALLAIPVAQSYDDWITPLLWDWVVGTANPMLNDHEARIGGIESNDQRKLVVVDANDNVLPIINLAQSIEGALDSGGAVFVHTTGVWLWEDEFPLPVEIETTFSTFSNTIQPQPYRQFTNFIRFDAPDCTGNSYVQYGAEGSLVFSGRLVLAGETKVYRVGTTNLGDIGTYSVLVPKGLGEGLTGECINELGGASGAVEATYEGDLQFTPPVRIEYR